MKDAKLLHSNCANSSYLYLVFKLAADFNILILACVNVAKNKFCKCHKKLELRMFGLPFLQCLRIRRMHVIKEKEIRREVNLYPGFQTSSSI